MDPITTVAPVASTPAVAPISNTPYVMTPAVATNLVNQYGIDPNQVLSSENINQTINNPTPAPDDLLGIRNQLYADNGVNTAQQAYQTAQQAASSATLGLNERLTGLRGRAVSMSKITGTQAQERAVSQGEIDALNESARLAQADYAAKKGNADELFQIRNQEISEKKAVMLQYPGAKIGFGDSFEQVTKKLTKYQDEVKKQAEKDAFKSALRDLGLKTSGSYKDLEKRLTKAGKEKAAEATKVAAQTWRKNELDIQNTISTIAERDKKTPVVTGLDKYGEVGIANFVVQAIGQKSTYGIPADALPYVMQTLTPEESAGLTTYNPSAGFNIGG